VLTREEEKVVQYLNMNLELNGVSISSLKFKKSKRFLFICHNVRTMLQYA